MSLPNWSPPSWENNRKLTDKHIWSCCPTQAGSKDRKICSKHLSFCKILSPFKHSLTSGCVPLSSWVSESKCLQVLFGRAGYMYTRTHRNKHTCSNIDWDLRVHWAVWGVGMSKEDVRLCRSVSPGLHKLIPEAGWKETAERNQRKRRKA